jgi:tripartite-type tricarboxylate transporter receptor subunit TctC
MRKFGLALAMGLPATVHAFAAAADAFPNKPVTLIVPFAAGSTTDIFARHLSERLKAHVSQPVVVEAVPGANGIIGANAAKSRRPDGHTIFIGTITTQVANYGLFKSVPYQPSDFKAIACLYSAPPLVAIRSSLPIKSIVELVDYAKNNPGKLTYGWSNSTTKIGGELLSSRTGTGIRGVPYKGSPQIVTDMLGERVDIYVDSPPLIMPHVKDGTMRVLATLAPKRAEALPDLPNLKELGYENATMDPWVGAFVRAETPDDTMKEIVALFDKVTASPELKDDLRKLGQEAWRCTPSELDQTVKTQIPIWERLISSAGIEKQ